MKGANHSLKDNRGSTPIAWAKRWQKQTIIDMLIQYGALPPQDEKALKNNKKSQLPVAEKVNENLIPREYVLTILKDGQYEAISEQEL